MENYSYYLFQQIKKRANTNHLFSDLSTGALYYSELFELIQKTSDFFRSKKIPHNAKIVIVTKQEKSAIVLFLSALLEGLCPILLHCESKSIRVQTICLLAKPALVMLDKDLKISWPWINQFDSTTIEGEMNNNSFLKKILSKKQTAVDIESYPKLLAHYKKIEPACSAVADDLAYIVFTSGTTSEPKGVMITHQNLFEHLASIVRVNNYTNTVKIFNNLILSHVDGLVQGPLLVAYIGGTLIRPQNFSIQNIDSLLNKIFSERATHFIVSPTMFGTNRAICDTY